MAGIDGIAGRLLFRPIRIHGRSRSRDEETEGVGADLSGEVEVAVDQLQREHEEEDEDRRQGHGRRRRRREAEPRSLSRLRPVGLELGLAACLHRPTESGLLGCTSSRSRQWRDARARGPFGVPIAHGPTMAPIRPSPKLIWLELLNLAHLTRKSVIMN